MFYAFGMKREEIIVVCEYDAPFTKTVDDVLLVACLNKVCVACGRGVDTAKLETQRNRTMHVFVKMKPNRHRRPCLA